MLESNIIMTATALTKQERPRESKKSGAPCSASAKGSTIIPGPKAERQNCRAVSNIPCHSLPDLIFVGRPSYLRADCERAVESRDGGPAMK